MKERRRDSGRIRRWHAGSKGRGFTQQLGRVGKLTKSGFRAGPPRRVDEIDDREVRTSKRKVVWVIYEVLASRCS